MMERAEKTGLGVALVGHAALFALLSLHLMPPTLPVIPPQQAIEVSLAPDVALQQAAPPAPTPPAASEAPEQGAPEEEAVPDEPTPPAPQPKPAPPKPAPPKAAPAEPKPVPPKPKPVPPKPAEAKPAKPTPTKRADAERLAAVVADAERADAARASKTAATAAAHAAWVEKVKAANAAKTDAARAAAARTEAAQAAAAAARVEAAQAAAARADAARVAAAAARKARGSRLGNDFLKGLADTPAKTPPSAAAPGAVMSAKAAADIGSAILRQVQPCADRQGTLGPGAEKIRVSINLKLNRDGSLAAAPRIVNHDGIDTDNRRYLDRVDESAIATFTGCSPLRGLPATLYDVPNGWRSFTLRFNLRG